METVENMHFPTTYPTTLTLVERGGPAEHALHRRDRANVPCGDVLRSVSMRAQAVYVCGGGEVVVLGVSEHGLVARAHGGFVTHLPPAPILPDVIPPW